MIIKPLFDFNGNGEMDMLEFMMASGTLNPNNPMNRQDEKEDFLDDDFDDDNDEFVLDDSAQNDDTEEFN